MGRFPRPQLGGNQAQNQADERVSAKYPAIASIMPLRECLFCKTPNRREPEKPQPLPS
jgi:hypothetical protein